MEYETVTVEYDSQTGVGHITLDRPDSLNALSEQLSAEIVEALKSLETQGDSSDRGLRVVVIEGAGEKAFCAGADINGFSSANEGERSERRAHEFIPEFPVPVVAKIDGYCLGGGFELALSCDLRLASDRSTFGFPEVDLGLLPGAGGVQFVTKLCGPAVAMELAMTGEHVAADWVHEKGLINRIYDSEEFDESVDSFVASLAEQAPLAVQAIKRSARTAVNTSRQEGRRYDRQQFNSLLNTEDFEEGAAAFAENRDPEFVGR
ncbi:enoyl-CoA hydratase/isomerase family protein [Halocatena halophila]|uniref:enoyl-CoA hydratase/isomerase family protein n=1 Tax=Halocatena halophila TaxID=2814576 RepID=UPI002ED0EC95